MKNFFKLPLYAGLAVFIIAVLFASLKIGEKTSLTYNQTRASATGAILILKYTSPDNVSVLLNSDKDIAGADLVIKYDKEKINVLPSTLTGSDSVIVSGGVADSANGTFTFSIIPKSPVKTGILATFKVKPLNNLENVSTAMEIVAGNDGSAVLDNRTLANILTSGNKINFGINIK